MPKRSATSSFGPLASGYVVSPSYKRAMKAKAPARAMVSSRFARAVAQAKETGYVDLAQNYDFDTTGDIFLLNTIAQGTSVNQRVGKKVMMKSLQLRGYVFNNSAALYNDCALLVVYDRRPTGSLPAITDILVSANAISLNNDNNSGRFKILKRCDFELVGAPSVTTGTEASAATADFYLSLRDLPTVYKSAATGAIADIEEGALYLVTVGINAAGTSAAAGVLNCRVRFYDN